MAYDTTMEKAAYVHELIKAQGNRPDVPCGHGSLHFEVRQRNADRAWRIILRYYYPPRHDLLHGIYTTETLVGMDDIILTVIARCNPKDQPRRFLGRTIALMRMARILAPLGYDVLAVWGKGKDAPHMVIPGDVQIPKDWMPQEVVERLWRQQRAQARRILTAEPAGANWEPAATTVNTGWKPTASSCNVSGCSCCDEGGRTGG